MMLYAVLTGDIVKSSRIKENKRTNLLDGLKDSFADIKTHLLNPDIPFEIYRGDSFQAVLKQPQQALLVSLIIRAKLRSITETEKKGHKHFWDARVSIGIGTIDYKGENMAESDGEAFQLSGRGLEEMEKQEGIKIQTPWQEINQEFEVACALGETIIRRWTVPQAEVIYPYLLEKKTQKELAKEFDISQPAVRKRLMESGNMDAIQKFIKRYENVINSKL